MRQAWSGSRFLTHCVSLDTVRETPPAEGNAAAALLLLQVWLDVVGPEFWASVQSRMGRAARLGPKALVKGLMRGMGGEDPRWNAGDIGNVQSVCSNVDSHLFGHCFKVHSSDTTPNEFGGKNRESELIEKINKLKYIVKSFVKTVFCIIYLSSIPHRNMMCVFHVWRVASCL